jgi:hypothetical protein
MYSLTNIRCMVPFTIGTNLVPDSLNNEYLKLKQCVVVGSPTSNEPVIVLLVPKLSVKAATVGSKQRRQENTDESCRLTTFNHAGSLN